jgi:tetrahydromethanopterin S-methyltransferase subunit H
MAKGFLQFAAEQKSFDIGGVKVGGQPGVRPTVLVGTVFYHGHKVLRDDGHGGFDPEAAERVIRSQDEWSQKTGNPCMLDVVGDSPEAMCQHLEFAARVSQAPLLIDGTTTEVRLAGLKYAAEAGLKDRVVYNSVQPETQDDELQAIRDAGVNSAILLTYYLLDFTAAGRVESVRQLLPRLEQAGIHKLMVDTCFLDLATYGQACQALFEIKDEFGLPAGGGVHNAVATWKGLKKKLGGEAKDACVAAACASAVAIGGDFLLYGPAEDAKYVFPAVAMIDTAQSQVVMERGGKPDPDHPRYRVG